MLNEPDVQEQGEYILSLRPNTSYIFRIRYPGFQALEVEVLALGAGQTEAHVIRPAQSFVSGSLVLETDPADAVIEVQGIVVGRGNIQLDLIPGDYSVKISKDGYDPEEFTASIIPGGRNAQIRPLSKTKQPLTVTSNVPQARVFFNGREIGLTPLVDFPVDQGEAVIRVESPGYDAFTETVLIGSDGNNTLEAYLEPVLKVVRSSSAYVRNELASIRNGTLTVEYDLLAEKKQYNVEVTFLGPDNNPIEVSGLSGDFGKKLTPGEDRAIYWPIPADFPIEGVKVQIDAKPRSNLGWLLIGGGLGVGGGVALAVLRPGDPEPGLAEYPLGRP